MHSAFFSQLGAVVCLAAAILSFAFFSPPRAQAGAQSDEVVCATTTSGGHCRGNLRGFARHGDSRTHVHFIAIHLPSSTLNMFWAKVGADTFSCSPQGRVEEGWAQTIGFDGHFRINWNSSGQCTSLWLSNGSEFKSYAATP